MNTRLYARPDARLSGARAGGRYGAGASGPHGKGVPRKLAALAVGLGGLLALLLATAAPASAHAALIRTDPADGSVVQAAPQRVLLTFSEGVLLSDDSLRVLDPQGANVAVGTAAHADGKDSGSTATISLHPELGHGTYTVSWRAVSQDSHPVAGAFTFSIGTASKTTVDLSAAAGGGTAGALYGIARWFAYAGFALLVGASVFLSVCWPRGALLRPMRGLAAGGWATLVAATIALIMLRGPYVNGTGLSGVYDTDLMRSMLETQPGAALLSRLLLLAAAAVFLSVLFGSYAGREDPAERADPAWGLGIGSSVVAVGIAATWAMAEHASVGIQHEIAMPVDVVHLLSMAVWLGGLITLLTALWAPSTAGTVERAAVRRFSTLALAAITTLIGTGTYQAWRQMGTWQAFTDTSYGRLLLIKIGLVCALVGVAWFSRRWTRAIGETSAPRRTAVAVKARQPVAATAAAEPVEGERAAQLRRQQAARTATQAKKTRDADPARSALRRSVLAEAVVAVVLLAVTTTLTGTQPGRAAEEQKGLADAHAPAAAPAPAPAALDVPYDTGGPNGKGEANVALSPGRAGTPNEVRVRLTDPAGKPVDVPEVRLAFTLPARSLGPIPVALKHTAARTWTASAVQLPLPGTWQLSITVRTSAIDEVTETRNVKIAS
jgi:copper transport protein